MRIQWVCMIVGARSSRILVELDHAIARFYYSRIEPERDASKVESSDSEIRLDLDQALVGFNKSWIQL
eukprot:3868753-Pyramimonas_sp.AAC.1